MRTALWTIISLISLLWVESAQGAQDSTGFNPKYHPTLQVPRVDSKITIDGDLSEPAWREAAIADGFAENQPGNQIKPPVDQKVLICYDEHNLYLGFVAYDDPKTIRYSLRDRDDIFSDDYFGILFDTYGDASWGYELFVNPLGIQGDLRMLGNGNEDMSLDLVWESRGKVTDSGYQVEVAIPFSSLRFPNKPEQVWKAQFWRDRQREVRRKFSWAALNRDNPCFMCQFGTLTGITGIKPGSKLDLLPNIVASQQGELVSADSTLRFQNDKADEQLALNAKYALSSNSSAELTINPDFSQVESDATQIDVNSPYALFYSEPRPFFQEGADLFDTRITSVYTRSIARPQYAAKLTGRFGRTNVAYLVARDDKSPIIVPLEEKSYVFGGGKSVSNIARIKQTFWEDSYIGAVVTDRRQEGNSGGGSLVGGDLALRFLKNYRYEFSALASRTQEPNDTALSTGTADSTFERGRHTVRFDGEQYWGHALYSRFMRDARVWSAQLEYQENSPTFRADNGFVTKNDFRQLQGWTNLFFRPNKKYLITWYPMVIVGRVWNFDHVRKDEWFIPHLEFTSIGQTDFWVEYLWSREQFRGVIFPGIKRAEFYFYARPGGIGGFSVDYSVGRFIARGDQLPVPVLGKGATVSVSMTLQPARRLSIEPSLDYSNLYYPDGGPRIFEASVTRCRFIYQFTRELFLRLVAEYRDFDDYNGDTPMTYTRDRGFTLEPLLSYKLNPFTIFYIGSTHDYEDLLANGAYRRNSQRFFVKFQYLFRV